MKVRVRVKLRVRVKGESLAPKYFCIKMTSECERQEACLNMVVL